MIGRKGLRHNQIPKNLGNREQLYEVRGLDLTDREEQGQP